MTLLTLLSSISAMAQANIDDVVFPAGGDRYLLDFGADTSVLAQGALRVTPNASGAINWGSAYRNAGAGNGNSLEKDWVFGTGNQRLTLFIASGVWTVRITVGHGSATIDELMLKAQGYTVVQNINVESGSKKTITFTVTVDRQLIIDLETDHLWAIQSLELDNGKIVVNTTNTFFQYDTGALGTPLETGWRRLTPATWGDVYWQTGVRSLGKGYGRLKPLMRDIVYESGRAPGKLSHKISNGIWKIEGAVTAVWWPISHMNVQAEGIVIADALNPEVDHIQRFEGEVAVTDNVLDLVFYGVGSSRWGLSYLRLTKVASLHDSNSVLSHQVTNVSTPDIVSEDDVSKGIASKGNIKKGHAIVRRPVLDGWKAVMVISKEQVFTNTSEHDLYINIDSFSFYAENQSSPITSFVAKVEGGEPSATVVAVGDTYDDYLLGVNHLPFTSRNTPAIRLEPGETLAFGFLAARQDGSNVNGSPIPYSLGGDTVAISGGPNSIDSAKLSEWAPSYISGSRNTQHSRTYSYSISFTSSPSLLLGDAENASVIVAPIVNTGNPLVANKNFIISESIKPLSISRQNERYGGSPYDTNLSRVTTAYARRGTSSLQTETLAITSTDKQRVEYNIGGFNWEANEEGAEYYYAFSFRLDSTAFDEPKTWFNFLQFNQGGSGEPGKAPFHQVVKLEIKQGATPSLIKIIALPTFGVSNHYTQPYQGNYRSFTVEHVEKDQWYDLVLGIRIDTDGDAGFCRVWLKKAEENQYRLNKYEGRLGFLGGTLGAGASFGIYKGAEEKAFRIFYDEIRKGTTFESVDIRMSPNTGKQGQ